MAVDIEIQASPTAETLKALLLNRFQYADAYRQQWDKRAIDWYKLYIGWREEIPQDDVRYGRSNLHIPRPYEELDALRARIVKSFFGQRPYMDFLPVPSPDTRLTPEILAQAEDKASVAAALVDMQLERNQIRRVWYDFVTSFLVFPAAILSVGWRYEERLVRRRVEEPVFGIDPATGMQVPLFNPTTMQPLTRLVEREEQAVIWDDNELQNVDFWDFWIDPRGHDIDSARFVFHREWLTVDALQAKLDVLAEAGSGSVLPINWDEVHNAGAHLEEGKWERLSAIGISADVGGDHWGEGEHPGKPVEVLHYWTDEEYGILINRHTVAYWGDNPYWRHGKKPYVMCSFDPLPGEPYGMSAMQVIEHLAHELNTLRNQRVDNISLAINQMMKIRRGADIDLGQLVFRPGGYIEVDNPDDIEPLAVPNLQAGAYSEEAVVKQDMENALGVASVVRGVDPGQKQTATEIVTKQTNAGVRFEVKIALYQVSAVNRLAMLMDLNNQQFIDSARYVQMLGQEALAEWRRIEPGELVGEHDYRPAGSNMDPASNREVRRQQLRELIEAVWKLQIPYVNRYELFRALVDTYELRNPSKILIPWQELMQMQLMQMAQQQAMQQMAPPGMMPQGLPPPMGQTMPSNGPPGVGG